MAVVHIVYALVNNKEVKNLAVGNYYNCSRVAIDTYGEGSVAVDCTQYAVEIGDTYEDGEFSRIVQGQKMVIERQPTEEETVAEHTAELASHDTDIDDLWVAILEG